MILGGQIMKVYYVVFESSDNHSETYRFNYKKQALEKYNEFVERCYFAGDFVFLESVERISTFPELEDL